MKTPIRFGSRAFPRCVLLLCCIVLAAAWFASSRWPTSRSFHSWRIESFGGVLVLYLWGDGPEVRSSEGAMRSAIGTYGMEWPTLSSGGGLWTVASIPYWIIFSPLALVTAIVWYFAGKQHGPGRCRRCGYDLFGNTAGVCPECGTRTSPSA